ncbi:hypothetical protein P186_0946 [Pyrobaculum ferrireducens]|uniref:Uncharacterized protein n=1 Tax=Pyrobaculum ferrireducens TaxID=1104324 RepID=G7VBF7_9CREN|nr:hypothetical protein P186_0946 [Pyrobaculum ferrireducens]
MATLHGVLRSMIMYLKKRIERYYSLWSTGRLQLVSQKED